MAKNEEKRNRTRQRLTDALAELCEEKPYYDITIEDICHKADLYRSTFYRYFETKDDMLREIERVYVEDTRFLTKSLENIHYDSSKEDMEQFKKELTADMEYHRANAKLCRMLLAPEGDLYFRKRMVESIGDAVGKNLKKYGNPASNPDYRYFVNFFAAGVIDTIYVWLEKDDKSPEEMADFLLAMIQLIRT